MVKIILVLGLFLVAVAIFMTDLSKIQTTNEVAERRDFSCDGMEGFSFQYPVFEGWEVSDIVSSAENKCAMFFKWPDGVEFEKPPQITIEKSKDLTLKSSRGAPYKFIEDPGLYTEGHVFKEGEWDFLVFYGDEFGVKISRADFGSSGFNFDLFYKTIVETFAFAS